jgi:hypothetical protein
MSSWSRPVERRYSKIPLFLSYTKSITTGREKSSAESERKATEMIGKMFVNSLGVLTGLTELAGIRVIMFDRIVPKIDITTPRMM